MSNPKKVFIERREGEGDYAVRKEGSERASTVTETQKEAIEEAQRMFPDTSILVERVRTTEEGKPDKWRKP
jgi:Uncharacterized protein conserved in bacteria (DUF2188)